MLHQQTQSYITGLSNPELLEYVLTGTRKYEAEAIEYARFELETRKLSPEYLAELRPPIVQRLSHLDMAAPREMSPRQTSRAILCQACQYEAPTRYAEYRQNVGALVLRFSKVYRGSFCKKCHHRTFWKVSIITLLFGWWGTISFFASLGFLIGNVLTYLAALFMPSGPRLAPSEVDQSTMEMLIPLMDQIVTELNAGTDTCELSRALAPKTGLTPGQVLRSIQVLINSQIKPETPPLKPTFGFPVVTETMSHS